MLCVVFELFRYYLRANKYGYYHYNNVFSVVANLNRGKFHCHLRDVFAPLVIRYIDLMESSIAQSLHRGFQKENWSPVR